MHIIQTFTQNRDDLKLYKTEKYLRKKNVVRIFFIFNPQNLGEGAKKASM